MSKTHMKIIGDVHQKYKEYIEITKTCKGSLQIGDMGFDYLPLLEISCRDNKFFGGNHERMDLYHKSPHSLGDYGEIQLGSINAYFIRGAFSIDKKYRVARQLAGGPISWWEDEQLSYKKLNEALDEYTEKKPRTMITHTCPIEVSKIIGNPRVLYHFGHDAKTFKTNTQQALQACFDAHKPDTWIFGHFHKDVTFEHKGTLFICLEELATLDVDENGNFNHNGYKGKI